ncbi:hypothetical protein F5878DRAFT_609326 [Lentinula raphanica]|uniref:Fungal-type protein kinase domain-containing protein n=1 Tax=Lentinula raphanica TaxID=153919 RepID=A0AA38UHV9_9AGAR|nr:hypothetical protein F5878DRAFT_609326 [Lentinula raphanica]
MLFTAICIRIVVGACLCTAQIRAAPQAVIPLRRDALDLQTPATAALVLNTNDLKAGHLERRAPTEVVDDRTQEWRQQLEETPWIDLEGWKGFDQQFKHIYFYDLSKKVAKMKRLPEVGEDKLIFTLPADVRYSVESRSGKTYEGDQLVLKLVSMGARNGHWRFTHEAAALAQVGQLVEAGFIDLRRYGVIVMLKQKGKPLHKYPKMISASIPLESKIKVYFEVQDQACIQIYDWVAQYKMLSSDISPLNLLVELDEESVEFKFVHFVDLGPEGLVGVKYVPTIEEFIDWFIRRWNLLWDPYTQSPNFKLTVSNACSKLREEHS